MTDETPPGFKDVPRAAFMSHVGPVLEGVDDPSGIIRLGVRVAEKHCNTLGYMHGGMIATLVDSAMARAQISKVRRKSVTLKMTLEYIDAVKVGEWLVAEGKLSSHDDDIAYTTCEVRAGDSLKAQGTGVFRLLKPY